MNLKFLFTLVISFGLLAGCGAENTTKEQPVANALASNTDELSSSELATKTEEALEEAQLTLEEIQELDVAFDYDSDVLNSDVLSVIDQHVEYLKLNSSATATIEGNTDERGTNEYNLSLGERRAKSVFDYLVVSGIEESRLESISYGELQPIADCHEERCWRVNRRVELNYK